MPRFVQPFFALSRAGFVRPGEVRAEDDDAVTAWLTHLDAGRIAGGGGCGQTGGVAGAGLWMAPAGAGFVRAA